jgi:hypothetical protein
MKRTIFLALAATVVATLATTGTQAQQRETYSYTVQRTYTKTRLMNWRPEQNDYRRYTVGVSPLRLMGNGMKFDFEWELPKAGHWLGTSFVAYLAPPRPYHWTSWVGGNDYMENNRSWFLSGFDGYNRMWGLGTSLMYKNVFSRRGWYFQTGMVFDFWRVGVTVDSYVPYTDDGLTFYEQGRALEYKSYFKPDVRFNFGKHIALSERCFFDLYAGLGLSYSLYADDDRHSASYSDYYYSDYGSGLYHNHLQLFTDIGGFAYRGLHFTGGFRFGMLLWKKR